MELLHLIGKALKNHPAHIIAPGDRSQTAVALIIETLPNGANILFIERSTNENDFWSGQLALPGGRTEKSDKDPRDTAERETSEEIGLDLSATQYLGRLSDIAPGGLKIVVSCFVYAVHHRPALRPDRNEIADIFWVPVRKLIKPDRLLQVGIKSRGRPRRFPAIKVVDDKNLPLWGLTYRLLRNFDKVMASAADKDYSLYKEACIVTDKKSSC